MNLSALPPVEIGDPSRSFPLQRRQLDLVGPVTATHGMHQSRRVLLVSVSCSDGTTGWGECGAPDSAGYTDETADAAQRFLERTLPRALGARRTLAAGMVRGLFGAVDPDACSRHPMAISAVETAVLDAQLRRVNTAFETLFGTAPKRTATAGATLSNSTTTNISVVDAVVADALEAIRHGYSRLKLKIGPGLRSTETVRALREVIGDDIMLVGDANGSYSSNDVGHLASLGELGLDIVEQPFAPHDSATHQELVRLGAIRVALDEGVRSASDALDALVNHECTDLTLKPARFGYLECVEVLNRAIDHGAQAWIGGMFDTGVARWANVRLAAHPAVGLASDIGASDRYWASDVTDPVVVDAGFVTVPGIRNAGLSGVPLDPEPR